MADKKKKVFLGFYFDFDKEEKWVNSICAKGWKLERIILGIFFIFSKCEPNEYEVKYYFTSLKDLEARKQFVREWGYEAIPHSSDLTPWLMYLVRRKSDDNAEIASDVSSRLEEYNRRNRMFTVISVLFMVLAVALVLEFLFFALFPTLNDSSCSPHDIFMLIFTGVWFLILTFCSVVCLNIRRKIKAKIKCLEKDNLIYQ